MAPKTLKQQPLGFTTRRSAAASNAKVKESNSPVTVPSTPVPIVVDNSGEVDATGAADRATETSSLPGKRKTRASAKAEAIAADEATNKKRKLHETEESSPIVGKGKGKEDKGKRVFMPRDSLENVEGRQVFAREDDTSDVELDIINLASPDTSEKAKKARVLRHYGEVREKMGHLEPIHGKGQKKEHHILRVFDLSYEYGPCVGMTRLQRWERAEAMGLNPPLAVKEILLDEQPKEESAMGECVFFGEV